MAGSVLYKSDTELFLIFPRCVSGSPPEFVDEMRLIGIEVKVVFPERLLHSQNLEQVVWSESRRSLQGALQMARRHARKLSH